MAKKWGCSESSYRDESLEALSETDGVGVSFDFESLESAFKGLKKTSTVDQYGVAVDIYFEVFLHRLP